MIARTNLENPRTVAEILAPSICSNYSFGLMNCARLTMQKWRGDCYGGWLRGGSSGSAIKNTRGNIVRPSRNRPPKLFGFSTALNPPIIYDGSFSAGYRVCCPDV